MKFPKVNNFVRNYLTKKAEQNFMKQSFLGELKIKIEYNL